MEQIKISEKLENYVENKEKVENILNQCKYDLIFNGINEKEKQYKYILYINDIKFDYFEGMGNEKLNNTNKQDKLLNAIWCLLTDRQCVNNCGNFYQFACDYGYNFNTTTLENGYKIYNDINSNNTKLLKCFNEEQLDFLTENIKL